MTDTTVQSAPAGFFQGSQVNEQTAQDLVSATADALTAVDGATTAAAAAVVQAAAAVTAATAAASSLASVATSVTAAATSATAAASSATTAGTSATNAATSATAAASSATDASGSATTATSSASTSTTQASASSSSATAAASSASAASTSASNAATSATAAASSATSAASSLTTINAAVAVETTRAEAAEAVLTTGAASTLALAQDNVGRNLLHNGEFLVQQRGAGAFTANNAYSADRWMQIQSTSTNSVSFAALADADRTAIGDEAAVFGLACAVGGSAGAGDYAYIAQRMESVRRTGGKSLTISFWAKASSGTPKIGVGALQSFGAGGSPSSGVTVTALPVTISTTMARYSVTLAIPSTSGKTIGTTLNTDFTELLFWLTSGATNNTIAGGVGNQSATFTLWGVQAEVGTGATSFEKRSYSQHWQDCIRFFYAGSGELLGYGLTSTTIGFTMPFLVPMRVAPTVAAVSNSGTTNVSSTNAALSSGNNTVIIFGTVTSTGNFQLNQSFTASADL